MASFGHCGRCGGHYGMCTDHTACRQCECAPVGWKCPVCGAGLAPTTKRCPCVDSATLGGMPDGVVFSEQVQIVLTPDD